MLVRKEELYVVSENNRAGIYLVQNLCRKLEQSFSIFCIVQNSIGVCVPGATSGILWVGVEKGML